MPQRSISIGGSRGDIKRFWYLPKDLPRSDCDGAYQAVKWPDYSDSKVNLSDPSIHTLMDTGHVPAWDKVNGWKFDGISQYLATDICPSNTSSVFIRFTNASAVGTLGYLFGVNDASPFMTITIRFKFNTTQHSYAWGNGGIAGAGVITGGSMAITPRYGYVNGIKDTSAFGAWIGGPVRIGYFIGALNALGSPSCTGIKYIQYISFYKNPLSDAQVLELHNNTM